MNKNPDCTASPRWVATEEGYELLETSTGDDGVSYSYQHPETGVGLLITVRYSKHVAGPIFDWSIHRPQTHAVISAEWNQANGVLFLRTLIQMRVATDSADYSDSYSDGYSEDSVEDLTPKDTCKSCKQLRTLDSNGFCDNC
jgi:hypothetical protein